MSDSELKPNEWYFVRRDDGSLAPYRFYRAVRKNGQLVGEFFVGSMLQTWPLSRVVAQAQMPTDASRRPHAL